ncbi:MAG: TPM domain-containing protein [Candidatus Micrarchaeota archaeon]|nr:TPM domain-containing protein [Candidatus Micrarchaeota archaeon]
MRKSAILLFFVLLLFPVFLAQDIPRISPCLNDFSGVIGPNYKTQIEQICAQLNTKKGVELAIVIVPSTQPYDINSFAQKTFEKNAIGKANEDNGLLLVIATADRGWRLEVGYGLEGTLPDGKVGQIAREKLVPSLKNNNYNEGVLYFLQAIAQEINQNYTPRNQTGGGGGGIGFLEFLVIFAIAFIFFFILLFKISEKLKNFYQPPPTRGEEDRTHIRRPVQQQKKPTTAVGYSRFGGGRSGGGGASGTF